MKRIITLLVLIPALFISMLPLASKSSAAGFDAGRIIDDGIFNNKGSMSVSDIQNFLNSKVPVCDTNHLPGSGSQGEGPPWICLKDFSEGGKSAAQIIWEQAQAYNINPQVLLVTLQKENGLITDTWPYDWQYRTAMGFGCPDGAPCDAQWFGFTNQITQAAKHFRNFYDQNPNWYIPYRPGVNYIKWHPNSACGGSNVNIVNRATAALYSYTPYQPNQAALNNLYGTGDGCSSYGNRNFWRDFNNWFGSSLGVPTNWKFEKLDGASDSVSTINSNVGPTPTSIVFNNALNVFYYDVSSGDLKRSYADSNGWHFEQLDGISTTGGRVNSRVGWKPTVVNYQNSLHVFYYNIQDGKLRHAWSDSNGGNWQFETLDGNGGTDGRINSNTGQTPSSTVHNNNLHVFYHDVSGGDLREAKWDGILQTWNFQTLDGTAGSLGKYNTNLGYEPFSLTFGSSLQLFYYDSTNGNLRHAWNNGGSWSFENLDGDPGSVGRYNSNLGRATFGTVYNNTLQIYYYDAQQGNLRHAWADSRGWHFENLEGDPGSVSRFNSNVGLGGSATVYNGSLQLYYYDAQQGNLRHAWTGASGWGFENLDGDSGSISVFSSDLGQYSTSTVFNNTIQVFYQDAANGDLRHSWFTP